MKAREPMEDRGSTEVRGRRFVVVTGRSGAGRTVVADHLEDLGWRVVRNLPSELVPGLVEVTGPGDRVALVFGPGQEGQVGPAAELLRSAGTTTVLFLTASPETLVRRYNETRRVHPLSAGAGGTHLLPDIEREAERLRPARDVADIVLDSSGLSKHDLRRRIAATFGEDDSDPGTTHLTLVSFGFKHGLPLDADLVFDCRFLPNPHWVERLRPGTGLDAPVREYVLGQPAAPRFLDRVEAMLDDLLPSFAAERKTHLTVAVGCTGGRHRSVAMAEELGVRLRKQGAGAAVLHRDVSR